MFPGPRFKSMQAWPPRRRARFEGVIAPPPPESSPIGPSRHAISQRSILEHRGGRGGNWATGLPAFDDPGLESQSLRDTKLAEDEANAHQIGLSTQI